MSAPREALALCRAWFATRGTAANDNFILKKAANENTLAYDLKAPGERSWAGRVNSRTVSGTTAETFGFDTLGRMNSHVTNLGTFTYGYLGNSGQVSSRSIGGITTTWGSCARNIFPECFSNW